DGRSHKGAAMTAAGTPKSVAPRRRLRGGEEIPLWLWGVGIFVALYLVLPTLFVIPMSWSEATTFIFPPRGFTLRLYENFFTNARWIGSLDRSVLVAPLAAALASLVGTAAALGLDQLKYSRLAGYVRTLLMVPIVTPAIVIATSVYIAFLQWRLVGS